MNPISNLMLYNCKLDRTMHKTVDFSSRSVRDSYFSNSNAIATIVSVPYSGDAYFIRENKTIKVPINADVLDSNGVNYCRFNNPQSGTSQYFYCFIDDIEYVAPNTSALHLRTDVMLTNMGNFTVSECFVEREHIPKNDDVFYNQLTQESVDFGDIMVYSDERVTTNLLARDLYEFANNYYICIAMSDQMHGVANLHISYIGAVPNLCYYYCINWDDLNYFNSVINQHGQADAVISITAVPKMYVSIIATVNHENSDPPRPLYLIDEKSYSDFQTFLIVKPPTMANGYLPRNSKLLCFPFNYLRLHNHNNSSIDLKWENSNNTTGEIDIKTVMSLGPNSMLLAIPVNYENPGNSYYTGYLGNYDTAIECSGFPEIPWINDLYQNYIALNKNTIESQKFSRNYNTAMGLANNAMNKNATGVASTAFSGLIGQADFEMSMADLQNRPNTIKGSINANMNFKSGSIGIFVSRMACKPQFAEKIDKYFDMYGYNISAVKVPAWNTRNHYNYVKTSGVDIFGTIAKNDKETIANIFNSGVTFWHISGGGVYGAYDTNNE